MENFLANVDIYRQYFSANCTFNNVERKGVLVWLNAENDSGFIRYEVGVTFFPHNDDEDFGVSYDACLQKVILKTPGRRSKKKDKQCLDQIKIVADELASSINGSIYWDIPLREAQYE